MTIKELKELIKDLPDNAEVLVYSYEDGESEADPVVNNNVEIWKNGKIIKVIETALVF